MGWRPFGDSAYILSEGDGSVSAVAWADAVRNSGLRGIESVTVAYGKVVAAINPENAQEFECWVAENEPVGSSVSEAVSVVHKVPVWYGGGLDTGSVAEELGLSAEEVVSRHLAGNYRCEAVGFSPGFPYLSGLDPVLATVPRLTEPRVRVPAGSVAFAGGQAGIYPSATPGGWRIIGRTPLQIVDVEDGFFPIRPGDRVSFVQIDQARYEALIGTRLGGSD